MRIVVLAIGLHRFADKWPRLIEIAAGLTLCYTAEHIMAKVDP